MQMNDEIENAFRKARDKQRVHEAANDSKA